jgi:hypothetical protein
LAQVVPATVASAAIATGSAAAVSTATLATAAAAASVEHGAADVKVGLSVELPKWATVNFLANRQTAAAYANVERAAINYVAAISKLQTAQLAASWSSASAASSSAAVAGTRPLCVQLVPGVHITLTSDQIQNS